MTAKDLIQVITEAVDDETEWGDAQRETLAQLRTFFARDTAETAVSR